MVLFFDADVIFHANCDHLFETSDSFVFKGDPDSPFNAGLFLIRPSWQALIDINDVALTLSFDLEKGWMEHGPIPDWRSTGEITDWSFYGASVEQGLIYYYYICRKESANSRRMAQSAWNDRTTHFAGEQASKLPSA